MQPHLHPYFERAAREGSGKTAILDVKGLIIIIHGLHAGKSPEPWVFSTQYKVTFSHKLFWQPLQTIWTQIRTNRMSVLKCRSWSGSKLFDTLMVFLKEFSKVDFEKKGAAYLFRFMPWLGRLGPQESQTECTGSYGCCREMAWCSSGKYLFLSYDVTVIQWIRFIL